MTRSFNYYSVDYNRFYKLLELIILVPGLKQDIDALRLKYRIDGTVTIEPTMNQVVHLPTDKSFVNDVDHLLQKHNIQAKWEDALTDYILNTYSINFDDIETEPKGLVMINDPIDKDTVYLKLGPRTTKSDLDEAWKTFTELIGNTPRRSGAWGNPERNLKILKLHREGKTLAQVCTHLDYIYPNDRLEFGHTDSMIRKIIKDAYERVGLKIPKL